LYNNAVANPYIWACIGGGMLAARSFIFGSGVGIIGYYSGKMVY